MNLAAKFFVPGRIKRKQRARGTKSGIYYTPHDTIEAERTIAILALAGRKQYQPLKTPLKLIVTEKHSRPKKPSRSYPPRPDIDNSLKIIMDACNAILWDDDSQIIEIHCRKGYAANGDDCGVDVEVWTVDVR